MSETGGIRAWLLAFVVASGTLFGALIGIGCAIGANVCPFSSSKPFTTTDGAEIFAARCAQCHGREGEGGRGPSLVGGPVAELSFDELVSKIEKGRPFFGMPAFGLGSRKLTPEQIENVARYVFTTLRGKP